MSGAHFFTIYQVTHKPSGKLYVGKHITTGLDDGYMGSGKLIRRALKKHGVEQFRKEILFVFDNAEAMDAKERELVTEAFCRRKDTYNLCVGGDGGFSFINRTGKRSANVDALTDDVRVKARAALKDKFRDPTFRRTFGKRSSRLLKQYYADNESHWTGKRHTASTITKMKQSAKGRGAGTTNSQFGKMWITDGVSEKTILRTESVPVGWSQGRLRSVKVSVDGTTFCSVMECARHFGIADGSVHYRVNSPLHPTWQYVS